MDPSSLGKPRRQGPCRSYSSAPLPFLFPRSSVESSMPHLAVRRGLCCSFSPSQCFTFLNLGGTSRSAPVFLYHRGSHSVGRGALGIPHSSRGPQGTCGFFTWLTFALIVQKLSGIQLPRPQCRSRWWWLRYLHVSHSEAPYRVQQRTQCRCEGLPSPLKPDVKKIWKVKTLSNFLRIYFS